MDNFCCTSKNWIFLSFFHICGGAMNMFVGTSCKHIHTWRPEVHVRCLSQLLSTSCFEKKLLIAPGVDQLPKLADQQAPETCPWPPHLQRPAPALASMSPETCPWPPHLHRPAHGLHTSRDLPLVSSAGMLGMHQYPGFLCWC